MMTYVALTQHRAAKSMFLAFWSTLNQK